MCVILLSSSTFRVDYTQLQIYFKVLWDKGCSENMCDVKKENVPLLSAEEEEGEVDNKDKTSSRRYIGDDLVETLDIIVELLQSVADQLSLASEKQNSGSNVNSLNELSWETAAFEKEIRDRIQWFGEKISSIRIPRIIGQLVEVGKEYARENPVTALMLLALGLTSSAPVLLFLVFAIATILVTFLGFLFVEGTLLTVATVVLGGVIFVVGFGTLTAVLIGMLGYFTTSQAYMVVTGRSNIFNLLRKIPVIGRFFPEPSSIPESNESENLTSKPDGHVVANGKVGNGHGPPHGNHSSNNHYDFDEDDILDTDEEIDDIEEENVLNSDSDLGEDEDLGNQENISGANKAENHTASAAAHAHHHNDTEEPVLMNGESSSENKLVNGYGDSDDSENSEDLARDD